jgi:hypothetical protein
MIQLANYVHFSPGNTGSMASVRALETQKALKKNHKKHKHIQRNQELFPCAFCGSSLALFVFPRLGQ